MFRKLGWIFCGLQPAYYLRHFILISPLPLFILTHTHLTDVHTHMIVWSQIQGVALITVSWFLYPFSRFVYESVVNWIMGDNIFIANALIWLIAKLFTMALCFSFAIFLAPIAWIYIFWYFKFGDGKCDFNGDLQDRDGIITVESDD